MWFYIRTNEQESRIVKLWGHAIQIKPYGTFIVDHRHELADPTKIFIGYCITEPKTGMVVGMEDSVKKAVEVFLGKVSRRGMHKKMVAKIKEWTREHGILNEVT